MGFWSFWSKSIFLHILHMVVHISIFLHMVVHMSILGPYVLRQLSDFRTSRMKELFVACVLIRRQWTTVVAYQISTSTYRYEDVLKIIWNWISLFTIGLAYSHKSSLSINQSLALEGFRHLQLLLWIFMCALKIVFAWMCLGFT